MEKKFSIAEFAKLFDHSILNPFITDSDIHVFCQECQAYHFAAAAVNTAQVAKCVQLLDGCIPVSGAVGYPFGQTPIAVKVFETRQAIADGAKEIDYVMNISELKSGNSAFVEQEMRSIVGLCRDFNICVKVIIETCYLSEDEKRRACAIAREVKPDFVKTSTGYGSGGATVADIQLIHKELEGSGVRTKASGGIRTLQQVLDFVNAGAERIGTVGSVSIMQEFVASGLVSQ